MFFFAVWCMVFVRCMAIFQHHQFVFYAKNFFLMHFGIIRMDIVMGKGFSELSVALQTFGLSNNVNFLMFMAMSPGKKCLST